MKILRGGTTVMVIVIVVGIIGLVVGAVGGAFWAIVKIADAMDGDREED